MFMQNAWYVAAWSTEIGDTPLARTFLGEPVVLFRTTDGTAVALEDRCCHRHLPLSLGKVIGDEIECGYHGLRFDAAGACSLVPGQTQVPPGSTIRRYSLVERWGWLWIWMGDPDLADDSLIPDWWFMDHPDWKVVPGNAGKPIPTRCNYELITDNLLDLTHLSYVHADTIGNDAILDFPVKTERAADRVIMTRLMPGVPPPPLYKAAGGFKGNVDRWQIVQSILPCCTDVDVGCAEIGSGVLDGDRQQGVSFHAVQVPTPETENTSHFFYGHARCFQTDSAEMDEVYRRDFLKVFMEDVVILEAQQTAMDLAPDSRWVDINVDAPGIAMRNLVRDNIAAEAGG